jgi:subfamily B ATP-binding cassette protein MsbA
MKSPIGEVYKRYFRFHTTGLVIAVLFYLAFAAEGSIMGAISRYLVDEVLEVNLMLEPMLHGQPKEFVNLDAVIVDQPHKLLASSEQLADGVLPGERSAPVIPTSNIEADGGLQDRIAARPGKFTSQKLRLLVVVAIALFSVHLLGVGMQTWASVKLGLIANDVVFRMRRHIHEKLMRLQLSFHNQHQTGRLMSRAIDDMRVIQGQFVGILTHIATFLGVICINVSIMYYISPKLATMAILIMPCYFFIHKNLVKRIQDLYRVQRRRNAGLYGLIRDRLANPRVIKGFGKEKREQITFYRMARDLFQRERKIVVLSNALSMSCTFLSVIASAIPLGYGVLMVQRGELTVGYLLFFYSVCWGLFYPLAVLSSVSAGMQGVRIACERIIGVLDEPIIIADKPDAQSYDGFEKAVEIKKLAFKYAEDGPLALRDIDLVIPCGSRICLMGASGAGKSTLGMQLLRLYDPTAGQVMVDGIDIKEIKITHWRRRVSYVPQEPVLFSGTLASNILYGNGDATREQMIAAAKAAEIHEFVETLSDKYDTVIGENGLRLSGGQKQRISLARALVTNPDILVLDDCTSALDAETESKIQKTFKTALAGKTVVMISHRISAASNADKIVVLDHGRIAEEGEHQELFDKQGVYWSLVKDQLKEHHVLTMSAAEKKSAHAAA